MNGWLQRRPATRRADQHERPTPYAMLLILMGVILMLMLLPTTGCGQGEPSTTTTSLADASSPTTTSVIPVTSTTETSVSVPVSTPTGGYAHEPGYLESQTVDLSTVAGLDKAGLTDAQKAVLAQQSFVAVDAPASERSWRFWQVYESARYQGLPPLVTTDSVLNAYHELFDTLLQRLEEESLFAQAVVMTEALYDAASDQWNSAADPGIKEEARRNMAYFSVAGSLLAGAASGPADLPDVLPLNASGFFVDDVVITASAVAIDGVGGILGQAGPRSLRTGSLLPALGNMQFDSADLANMEANGSLLNVITHEMGHVIGFGTIWSNLGLLIGAGGADPRFTGAGATAQYNTIFGQSGTSVPVESTGGSGPARQPLAGDHVQQRVNDRLDQQRLESADG